MARAEDDDAQPAKRRCLSLVVLAVCALVVLLFVVGLLWLGGGASGAGALTRAEPDAKVESRSRDRLGRIQERHAETEAAALGAADTDRSPPGEIAALKEQAFGVARRLIVDLPDTPESHAVLAVMQTRFGRNSEAVATWRACLELDPDFADAYHGWGTIELKRGNPEKGEGKLSALAGDRRRRRLFLVLRSGQGLPQMRSEGGSQSLP